MIKCSKGREQILTALSSEVGISNQKEEEEDLESKVMNGKMKKHNQ